MSRTALLVACLVLAACQQAIGPLPRNIILIVADEMGWQHTSVPFWTEPTALNKRYRTPHLERFAARGMRFTNAYGASTRSGLLTGFNPARRSVPAPTMASILGDAGYRTIHVGADPGNLGFDIQAGNAVKAITDTVAARVPFFLFLAHDLPGTPAPRFVQRHLDAGLSEAEASHASQIEALDASVGAILTVLEDLGIRHRTIVVFLSASGGPGDNTPLSGGKGDPYEGGIRVPMMVRWPGVVRPHSVCHTPVVTEDLFPTVLELAGIDTELTGPVDGRSFVPLLRDANTAVDIRPLVWHSRTEFSAIRLGSWKLIHHHADQRRELFNLASDVGEHHNRAADHPEIVRRLSRELDSFLKRVGAETEADSRRPAM